MRAKQVLVGGHAVGDVVGTTVPLSFWGGVNPETGKVIDSHHELCGQSLVNRVLVMPSGRGSCTASVVLLECLLLKHAPAAILLNELDEILALGVILADELFSLSIPVVVVDEEVYTKVSDARRIEVFEDGRISILPV